MGLGPGSMVRCNITRRGCIYKLTVKRRETRLPSVTTTVALEDISALYCHAGMVSTMIVPTSRKEQGGL